MNSSKKARPGWHEYFLKFAKLAAKRSTCTRRHVGAVAVKNKHILATGYNGPVSGQPHCEEIGCLRDKLDVPSGQRHELCRGVHAEQNLIIQAARHGNSLYKASIYCTHMPCFICSKMLTNCGIKAIYFIEGYSDDFTKDLMLDAGITLTMLNITGV